MARGDVPVRGASGDQYTFNFGTNACCRIEAALNIPFAEALKRLRNPEIATATMAREFIKATIVSPADVTLDQAGDIMDDLGGAVSVMRGLAAPMTEAQELVPA
jgi:hypothetical protein